MGTPLKPALAAAGELPAADKVVSNLELSVFPSTFVPASDGTLDCSDGCDEAIMYTSLGSHAPSLDLLGHPVVRNLGDAMSLEKQHTVIDTNLKESDESMERAFTDLKTEATASSKATSLGEILARSNPSSYSSSIDSSYSSLDHLQDAYLLERDSDVPASQEIAVRSQDEKKGLDEMMLGTSLISYSTLGAPTEGYSEAAEDPIKENYLEKDTLHFDLVRKAEQRDASSTPKYAFVDELLTVNTAEPPPLSLEETTPPTVSKKLNVTVGTKTPSSSLRKIPATLRTPSTHGSSLRHTGFTPLLGNSRTPIKQEVAHSDRVVSNACASESIADAASIRRGYRLQRRTKYDLAYKQMESMGSFVEVCETLDLTKQDSCLATSEIVLHPHNFSFEIWDANAPISLGADGRRLLLRKLRSVFSTDTEHWQDVLQRNNLGDVRNIFTVATVPTLLKIAHLMGPEVWGYALKCACFTYKCPALFGKDFDDCSDHEDSSNYFDKQDASPARFLGANANSLGVGKSTPTRHERTDNTFRVPKEQVATDANVKSERGSAKRRRKVPAKFLSDAEAVAPDDSRSTPMQPIEAMVPSQRSTTVPLAAPKESQRSNASVSTPIRQIGRSSAISATSATHEGSNTRRKRKLTRNVVNGHNTVSPDSYSSVAYEKHDELQRDSDQEFNALAEAAERVTEQQSKEEAFDGFLFSAASFILDPSCSSFSPYIVDPQKPCSAVQPGPGPNLPEDFAFGAKSNAKSDPYKYSAFKTTVSNSDQTSSDTFRSSVNPASMKCENESKQVLQETPHLKTNGNLDFTEIDSCRVTQLIEQCLLAQYFQSTALLRLAEYITEYLKNRRGPYSSSSEDNHSKNSLPQKTTDAEPQLALVTQSSNDQIKIFAEMMDLMYKAHHSMPVLEVANNSLGLWIRNKVETESSEGSLTPAGKDSDSFSKEPALVNSFK